VPDEAEPDECIAFEDRWVGPVAQHLASEVGDFVLNRADGFWAYQLAVVVDDAEQGVSHVVRGADLLDSTARQIYLQRLLNLPTPRYLHVPVVRNAIGEKLSKQTGAQPLDPALPRPALLAAAQFLGLPVRRADSLDDFWQQATVAWTNRFSAIQRPEEVHRQRP
jgi:glutamyl-Q tRNA(Asp) synthetase